MMLDQQDYIDSLHLPSINNSRSNMKSDLLTSTEHTVFRGIVKQLNWVVQGMPPDITIGMINLSTKFKHATISDFL